MLKLYDGILDLLNRLTKAGVKLGLVTSKSRATTQMAFDLTGIEIYFDATVCCDEAPGNKPSAEPILVLPGRLGVAPADAAYVGDSPADIQAAHAAGVIAIAVTLGGVRYARRWLLKSRRDWSILSLSWRRSSGCRRLR